MRLVILAQDRQECLQLGRIVRGLFDHGGGRHDLGVQVAGDLAWKWGGKGYCRWIRYFRDGIALCTGQKVKEREDSRADGPCK
jgi:hypothetical protein